MEKIGLPIILTSYDGQTKLKPCNLNKNCARCTSARFPVRRGPAPFNVYVWKLIVCVILPHPRSAILDFVGAELWRLQLQK